MTTNKPLAELLAPIKEPEDLPPNATIGDMLQRAEEGRLGVQEANEKLRALRIQFGIEKNP